MNFSMRAHSICLTEIMVNIGKMACVAMCNEVLVISVFQSLYIIAETLTII